MFSEICLLWKNLFRRWITSSVQGWEDALLKRPLENTKKDILRYIYKTETLFKQIHKKFIYHYQVLPNENGCFLRIVKMNIPLISSRGPDPNDNDRNHLV